MTLTLIARADHGGLAAQTIEFYRHMHPDRLLLIDLGDRGAGATNLGRYAVEGEPHPGPSWRITSGYPTAAECAWAAESDVVFTVESTYGRELAAMCAAVGSRLVIQVNPELYVPEEAHGAEIVLPTTWEAARFPGHTLLPVPVALEHWPEPRVRTECRVLYHPTGSAMVDRNGTEILLAALQFVEADLVLLVRSPEPRNLPDRVHRTRVYALPPVADYWDAYPPEADVCVIPRRYGGLCLSAQEAMGAGMAVVLTDREPDNQTPALLIPAEHRTRCPMKGGTFDLVHVIPQTLGSALTELAARPDLVENVSGACQTWAILNSWTVWEDRYRTALGVRQPEVL